ncbi:MAG: nucleoside recognition protein [Lachnospiraceae bacterium]|nr:nucleoside recognition protein [Lachnospiraceae bacterium]
MNVIWGVMLLTGIGYGVLTGRVDAVSEALLSSAKEGVSLCVTMFGVMALWSGLMEIASDAGLIQAIEGKLRPVMRFLFPNIPEGHPALESITTNCICNLLGLGSASTVYGLKAMEELEALEEQRRTARRTEETETAAGASGQVKEQWYKKKQASCLKGRRTNRGRLSRDAAPRGTASNEMCNFLILNISSLQLIPMTIIAYRSQYGSVNPTAIIAPGIVATAVSTGVAVIVCRGMDRLR